MGAFQGVQVNRLNGGLNRRNPSDDGVMLLVVQAAVASTGLAINTAAELLTITDAESLGITPSYDDTNSILAHYHIDEFFTYAPDGNLFVVLADATFDNEALKTIIRENSRIKGIGIARNAAITAVAPATTSEVFQTSVAGYQNMVNELSTESILIDFVLLEGYITDDAVLVSAYDDMRAQDAPAVTTVIAQDPVIRSLNAAYESHACIGTALGMGAVRNVNENWGSLDIESKPNYAKGQQTYPLTNKGRARWINAVLQNGKSVNAITQADRIALDEKGYLFAGAYVGSSDYYFNNSNTSVELSSDYAYIENNRVWNKAARALRTALLPRVKSNLLKDPATGFINSVEAKDLETIGDRALQSMEAAGEISGRSVYIDPKQVISQNDPLKIKAQVVANDIIFDIEFDLGLTNNI